MGKRKVGALEKVEADLINLQNKIRRDPASYRDDFRSQFQQYEAMMAMAMEAPAGLHASGSSGTGVGSAGGSLVSLQELIDMIAHVADCYPDLVGSKFTDQLASILDRHHTVLDPDLRDKIVSSLVLLRNKDLIPSTRLQEALFPLLIATPSKAFRTLLLQKILADLRNANSKTTNHRLNRSTQTFFFGLVTSDRSSPKALWAVKITRELWRRRVWTDSRAVEIMKEASLAECPKVAIGGIRFFLGSDQDREESLEESDEDDVPDMRQLRHTFQINKKSKKKGNELRRAAATVRRKEKKKGQTPILNFSALHLLNDPQGYADVLFLKHLQQTKTKFNLEQKLLVLQLVTRLVGLHQLQIPALYSYFLKYLTPKQPSATRFLASLAQASHSLVPPDDLSPLVQKIANEFVSEAAASEVACAGLNSIREICVRQPLALEDTLLQDLVLYRKSKDKGVMMAAKGLLSLYRDVDPTLLKRRDRGKEATMGLRSGAIKQRAFGEVDVGGIEGLELLEKYKAEERRKKKEELGEDGSDLDERLDVAEEEEGWEDWTDATDSDDEDDGWINVASDDEDIVLSDSSSDDSDEDANDENRPRKKVKRDEGGDDSDDEDGDDDDDDEDSDNSDEASTLDPDAHFASIATTRILTPADLAKLQELRTEQSILQNMSGSSRKKHMDRMQELHRQQQMAQHAEEAVTAEGIVAPAALSNKRTKEERIALKGEKQKHSSSTAIRKEKKHAAGKSTTNKEKARKKNMMMTIGKARGKMKRSLTETRNILKGHKDRQKRGGRRGNFGAA